MSTPPIASVFNDAYAAEQFEAYRRDPASVEESWRQFFRFAEEAMGRGPAGTGGATGPDHDRKVAGAARYTTAIRTFGHLAVPIDPLGSPPPGAAELTLEFHGITDADLDAVSGASLGFPHLAAGALVIHANGSFHSDYRLGTVDRAQRRAPKARTMVVSFVPVADLDTALSRDQRKLGDFVVFTLAPTR